MDKRKCRVGYGSYITSDLASFGPGYKWREKRVLEDRKCLIVRENPFSMLAFRRLTRWPFLHCFQEKQLQISQQLRDKTRVCCFLVENRRASRGTSVPLPPRPSAGSTGSPAEPCQPCSWLCPGAGGATSKQGCGHRPQARGFPSAGLFCSFQQFASSSIFLPTAGLGLPVSGRGTEIQHLLKLLQSLGVEAPSV